MGERPGGREARDVRNGGVRAQIEDDLGAGERAGATVVQRDLDGLWADEASAPHDELRAALLVGLEVNRDLALDHVLLAAENLAHVRRDLADQGPEFCGVSDNMGDARAPDLVLGGHAATEGHEPPTQRRSTTATFLPDLARFHASSFPPWPLPRITTSKCSD